MGLDETLTKTCSPYADADADADARTTTIALSGFWFRQAKNCLLIYTTSSILIISNLK